MVSVASQFQIAKLVTDHKEILIECYLDTDIDIH